MGDFMRALLPGLAVMPNWHPLLVHFPIALLSGYFLLDLAGALIRKKSWRCMASLILYAGTFFAALTVALGLRAAATVPHAEEVHQIMQNHRNYGLLVLSTALLLCLWRRVRGDRWSPLGTALHLLTAAGMVLALARGADLGGLMVYGHAVGQHGATQEHHEHVHSHDEGEAHHHH